MYQEPWSDISEYQDGHRSAIKSELLKELGKNHDLFGVELTVLAKRENCDDILVASGSSYFIVHLTWSGRAETTPYPLTVKLLSLADLKERLKQDSEQY
ncbi:hypothetical protein [Photobacterium nomapromontoriensis]|uniref:hypothetical protein n=1 Tax=Photobacterium nomapromontoriensis TaxID=2910237 RepID=UPI003D13078A